MNSDLQVFVGTSEAKFSGKVFQTINLTKDHERLVGRSVMLTSVWIRKLENFQMLGSWTAKTPSWIQSLKNGKLLISEADAIRFEMKITVQIRQSFRS